MTKSVRIAIDAMGGDHGPEVILPGAALALAQHADLEFIFFGDEVTDQAAACSQSAPRGCIEFAAHGC